ncbi:MAG: hypothetical protein Ta2F_05080 [Termitinemataceae bacterium]|nr:MAG: hypothetical protein Ta2F_05080 [Termitinemataceae bacterium]
MIKRFRFYFYLFFISNSAFADDVFLHHLNADTDYAFKETVTSLTKNKVTHGEFEQIRTLKSQKKTLKSSGNFIIANGLGIVWQTLKPFASTIAVGKDFVIQTSTSGKKTKLDSSTAGEAFLKISGMISIIFSGDALKILDAYDVFFYKDKSEWQMGLIPNDKTLSTILSKITVQGNNDVINYIKMEGGNGDITEYFMSSQTFAATLTSDEKSLFI